LFREPELFKDQKEVVPGLISFADKVVLGNAVAGTFMWVELGK